jgi:RNA polymerase sigma factor for flagellar operon FliA
MNKTTKPMLAASALREKIVLENLPLVRFVANQVSRSLNGVVEFDDLVNSGTLGLIKAAASFDASRGRAFSTFAAPRIRGAMIDDLRRTDTVSRALRHKRRMLSRAEAQLQAELGRKPTTEELARRLGVAVSVVWRWRLEAERADTVSLNKGRSDEDRELDAAHALPCEKTCNPEEVVNRSEEVERLRSQISALTEREQVVLTLYYFGEMKLHEIARALGLTESRVSQIRSQSLATLRRRMAHLREEVA